MVVGENIIMQVSISKAHKMTGVARSTIYKDIEEGKLSVELDLRGKKLLNISELNRVYGSVDTSILEEKHKNEKVSSNVADVVKRSEDEKTPPTSQIAVLQERIKIQETKAQAAEEMTNNERKERQREREQLQERIEALEENLKQTLNTQNNLTALLEDKRGGTGEWEKSVKALEARIANQEKAEKERREREQKILNQNRRLKEALTKKQEELANRKKELDNEKNKTFFQKLFG